MSTTDTLPDFIASCIDALNDRKASDLVVYDVSATSILADYYIICSGNSTPHIRALSNQVQETLKASGQLPRSIEGVPGSHWVILDCSDVLVHIFHPDTRSHYQIEALLNEDALVYDGAAESA
jgi:ribosome-associated protein